MRLEVLLPIFLSVPFGLAMFLALSRNIRSHVQSFADKLSFFFWPFSPFRMLVVEELDGEVGIYYDYDFEEIKTEDKVLIRTIDGLEYVTEIPPSKASKVVSMFDARAPEGYSSPFALGWRWIVAAALLLYFTYYSLVTAWIPPIQVTTREIAGEILNIANQMALDPWEAMVATTVFFGTLTWFISNIMRMGDRTISLAWYHAKGINPPHTAVIPTPAMSGIGLLDYLEKLGRTIEIVVPDEGVEAVKKAMNELKDKTGSRSLAAVILAKLSMAKTWRQALAGVLRERFDLRKSGEAEAMIRLGIQPVTRRTLPILVVVGILAFVIGYFVGNAYGFSVTPAVPGNHTLVGGV